MINVRKRVEGKCGGRKSTNAQPFPYLGKKKKKEKPQVDSNQCPRQERLLTWKSSLWKKRSGSTLQLEKNSLQINGATFATRGGLERRGGKIYYIANGKDSSEQPDSSIRGEVQGGEEREGSELEES